MRDCCAGASQRKPQTDQRLLRMVLDGLQSLLWRRRDASRRPTAKFLIAGGFGVGKTTFVGAICEIRPLRTEEPLTERSVGVDDTQGGERQDHHHGGHGLRPDQRPLGLGALPVRHARAGALLVHVGRAGDRRAWCRGAGRHRRIADSFASIDYFERNGTPSSSPSTASTGPAVQPDDIRIALSLGPEFPSCCATPGSGSPLSRCSSPGQVRHDRDRPGTERRAPLTPPGRWLWQRAAYRRTLQCPHPPGPPARRAIQFTFPPERDFP